MGTVEINGKSYNTDQNQSPPQPSGQRFLDGFAVNNPKKHVTPITKSNHIAKPIKKSKTLHRSAVKKPLALSTPVTSQPTNSGMVQPEIRTRSSFISFMSKEREKRATSTNRSSLVSKFNDVSPSHYKQAPMATPVMAPAHTPELSEAPPLPMTHLQGNQLKVPNDLLIKNASKQPHTRKKRLHHFVSHKRKLSTIVTVLVSMLLIGGFIAYQNIPTISLRVAASRAGFDASKPSDVPSGFAFKGPIAYAPGQVIISFKSNTDDREFQINQRPSEWNSQTLLDNFVSKQTKQYQSFQEQGLTIFLYENSSATWVNKGIWYTLEGRSSLSPEQIVNIATSM